jgi:iron complex outermembrane receptor protein
MSSFQQNRLKTLLLATSILAVGVTGAAYAQDAATGGADVEQVVVTGSRLGGGFVTPTPVTVTDSNAIAARAPTTISDVVNQLPQLRQTTGNGQAPRGNSNGQNLVDLRGLGTNRTLVLMDGERIVPTNIGGTFDINLIPSLLVDRIDLVTGGASAAYGSDAVAGVLNFRMKDHIDGVVGSLQYGESEHGDNIEPAMSIAAGGDLLGGRLHLIGGGDFSNNHGVGTIYSRPDLYGKQQACQVSNTTAQRAANPLLPANSIVNGCTWSTQAAGSVIVGAKAGVVPSTAFNNIAFGPNGQLYNFQQGTVAGILMAGGADNPNDPHGNPNGNLLLEAPHKRWTAYGKATFDIDNDTTAFVQYLYGHSEATGLSTFHQETNIIVPVGNSVDVNGLKNGNPYVPATLNQQFINAGITSITVGKQEEALGGYQFHQEDNTWKIAAGFKGKIFGDWSWDATYNHGQSPQVTPLLTNVLEGNYLQSIYAVAGPNGVPVCGPVATNPNFATGGIGAGRQTQVSAGCQPFNIFGTTLSSVPGNGRGFAVAGISPTILSGNVGSVAAAQYFQHQTNSGFYYQQDVVSANLRGSPFNLPAGPVSLAAGIEHRREGGRSYTDFEGLNNYSLSNNGSNYSGSFSVTEGYVEVGLPLLKDLPFVQSLSADIAVRETGYSLFGNFTTFKAGLDWQATDEIRFRATRSRDVREPSITDLNSSLSLGITASFNSLSQHSSGPEYTATAGNPNLRPESANSTTVGVVYTPSAGFFEGLSASIDYFNVEINKVIVTQTNTNIDSYCAQGIKVYCAQIVPGGGPGGGLLINSIPLNLASQKTDGMDFEFSYHAPLDSWNLPGDLNIRWLTTWTDVLATQGVTYTDYAGSGVGGGVANWVSNMNITYALDGLTSNLQIRYTSDIRADATLIGPGQNGYSPALANSVNINQFPAQIYYDLSESYEIWKDDGQALTLFGTVNNLLDKDPPGGGTAFVAFITGGQPYDLIGRTFKGGVRFKF